MGGRDAKGRKESRPTSPAWTDGLALFLGHVSGERRLSEGTVSAYRSDLEDLGAFLGERGIESPQQVDRNVLRSYLAELHRRGLAARTVARRLAALRGFFRHLEAHLSKRQLGGPKNVMATAPKLREAAHSKCFPTCDTT